MKVRILKKYKRKMREVSDQINTALKVLESHFSSSDKGLIPMAEAVLEKNKCKSQEITK